MISPIAKRGRSSFTQVIVSPGLREGRGLASCLRLWPASGVAAGTGGGEATAGGELVAAGTLDAGDALETGEGVPG